MLKHESRAYLNAVQYKWQAGSVLMFFVLIILLRMASLYTISCGTASLTCFYLKIFYSFFQPQECKNL